MTTTTTTHPVGTKIRVDSCAAPQFIFGQLVKLATPVLVNYHSDLFHDATWLASYTPKDGDVYYFAISDYGTSIGTDLHYVEQRADCPSGQVWKITFEASRWTTDATFERVK